jgi:hypothetical protein
MRMFDAESRMMAELKDEGRVVAEKQYPSFRVTAVRHPTLGKLVLVEDKDGNGAVVESEE